jgi:Zn-dependent protease
MDVSNEQVRQAVLSLVAFVLSVSVHEFGHALVADRLGDGLPRAEGRVTLAPWRHIDLMGTIVVPLLAVFATGVPLIAWGKPVRTNPAGMTRGFSPKVNYLVVSLAGPVMNLLLALLVSVALIAISRTGRVSPELAFTVVRFLVVLNISLMFFNLLPIPPLDGAAILGLVLPPSMAGVLRLLYRHGMIVLLLLFATPVGQILMRPAARVAQLWSRFVLGMVLG